MACNQLEMQEPSIDTNKLSYEIFSILESKFLFGYEDQKLWIPKKITNPQVAEEGDTATAAIKYQRGKICILSIDGGGMRGIISGKALSSLEHALKEKSGNPDARIADYFDVAIGTGIGGIFTAMLFSSRDKFRPSFHADETWKFLADKGKALYSLTHSSFFHCGSRGTRGMEKAVKEAFTAENGRTLSLKDTLKPVLIPCYDLSTSAPFLFSRADALEKESFDFRLWEVCRATSAEPGLFDPIQMQSLDGKTGCVAIDGGIAAGTNPVAAAITHVLHNKQEFPFVRGVEDILVISIGTTGQAMEGRCEYKRVKGWNSKEWSRMTARISGDGAADMVDHAVAMAFAQGLSSGNYVRIQANGLRQGRLGANVDTDASPANVKTLVGVAEEMLNQKNVESVLFRGKRIAEQSNLEKLDWFAGELVQEHQRRSCRIAPTVAFKQSIPKST